MTSSKPPVRFCINNPRNLAERQDLMGWEAKVGFEEGMKRTIEWFKSHRDDAEARM